MRFEDVSSSFVTGGEGTSESSDPPKISHKRRNPLVALYCHFMSSALQRCGHSEVGLKQQTFWRNRRSRPNRQGSHLIEQNWELKNLKVGGLSSSSSSFLSRGLLELMLFKFKAL